MNSTTWNKKIIFFFSLVFVGLVAGGRVSLAATTPWTGILSYSRGTNWSVAGVPGGIPSGSWTQCGPTIAAYSGSPNTIINALNHTGSGYTNCGANQYIQLGAGRFSLSGAVVVTGVNNTALRGMGADQTFLTFTGTSGCQGGNGSCLVGFQSSDNTYPSAPPANVYNWTGGYAQGATSITLSSGANIIPNSTMVVLDQCDTGYSGSPCAGNSTDNGNYFECSDIYSPSGQTGCATTGPDNGLARVHRFEQEAVTVTSCSPTCGSSGPTTVTISPGLQHPNWSASQTPQAWLIQTCQYDGVENLSVDGAGTNDTAGVSFNNCINGWVSGVRVINAFNIGIWLSQDTHMSVVNNYIYNAGQNLTYADPTGIKYNGSDNLFQNNIIQAVRPAFLAEGPADGNVIGYNFTTNIYTGNDFMFGAFWDHSTGDDYNLWEGNVGSQFFQDQIHGSHLMETTFRNFFTGWESCANGQCGSFTAKTTSMTAVDDLSFDRYGNYIGNVIGTPGVTTNYQDSGSTYILYSTNNVGTAYNIGSGDQGGPSPVPLDPVVGTTMFRWGNWDTATGATGWNSSEVPSTIAVYPNPIPGTTSLPASFYLSSKPSWWGNTPWPAIGPDVTGGNVGQCSGTLDVSGKYNGVAATNASQCAGSPLNTAAWAGHVNAIPAMNCYLNVMGGPPDGSGGALTFNAATCYGSGSSSGSGSSGSGGSAPVITSAVSVSATANTSFSYQISALNVPTSYTASNLPLGLSVNSGTGLISGTPTIAGTYNATIFASNSYGTGSTGLTIAVASGITLSISGVSVTPATSTATISWMTNEGSISQVNYGLTSSYGSQSKNSGYTTSHNITVAGLSPATTYHYKVSGADTLGNTASTGDATFTTNAISGNTGGTGGTGGTVAAPGVLHYVQSATMTSYYGAPSPVVSVAFTTANVTPGDLIAVYVTWTDTTANLTDVTDSCGDVYTVVPASLIRDTASGPASSEMAYAKNVSGGSKCNVTATLSVSENNVSMVIDEIAGADTVAPLDVVAVSSDLTGNAGTYSSNQFTTTNSGDYIFGVMMSPNQAGGTIAAGSGYTLRQSSTGGNDTTMEDMIQSGAGVNAVGFVTNAYTHIIISGMAFKPAASATTSTGASAPPADTSAPSVPANLIVTPVSISELDLSWAASTDNVGVAGYTIYRNGAKIITTAGNSYADSGLSPGTSYRYAISAYDAAGNVSPQSVTVAGTTETASSSAGQPTSSNPPTTGSNNAGNNGGGSTGSSGGSSGGGSASGGYYIPPVNGGSPGVNPPSTISSSSSLTSTPASISAASTLSSLLSLAKNIQALSLKMFFLDDLNQNLTIGSKGENVWALQVYLIMDNVLHPTGLNNNILTNPSGYFGPLTRAALAAYQARAGVSPSSGFLGPKTRSYLETIQ